MIFKNGYGCCGKSALKEPGLAGFGSIDVVDLYRAVVGSETLDEMSLAVSQFLCDKGWASGSKDAALALLDSHMSDFDPDLPDNYPAQWGMLQAARAGANTMLDYRSSCQATVEGVLTAGVSLFTQLTNLGKQKTSGVVPPKVTPPSTANVGMFLGLGAAALAAVVLLSGRKS